MKKQLTILVFLITFYGFSQCNITQHVLIATQDFEDTPATPTLAYTTTSTAPATGQGDFPAADKFVSGSQGIEVNNATGTILFDNIDTSKYENVEFSIRLASFSGVVDNGCDLTDYVLIKIWDGTYSKEIKVRGKANGNNRWSFSSGTGTATVTYDGNNNEVVFHPTTTGDVTTEGYSTLKITDLPISSRLKIQIKVVNNSPTEYWVIDDAKLYGDRKDYLVWDNPNLTWIDMNGNATTAVPNSSIKAFFDTAYNMNAASKPNVTACECEVKTGKTVTIRNNKYLEIVDDIVNNGKIVVYNKGALVQINNGQLKGTGIYKIRKKTTAYAEYDYSYWSSPLTTVTIPSVFNTNSTLSAGSSTNSDDFSPANHIYSFETANFDDSDNNSHDDNNDDWVVDSGTMTPAKGYIAMGAGADFPFDSANRATGLEQSVVFIGDKVNNGDVTIPVVLDANTGDNFTNQNLIGNPYPSAIDGELFLNANTNVGTLYFWTHHTPIASGTAGSDTDAYNFTNDDYATFTTAGYAASASGATVPSDKLIASCQGFFADINTAGTVTFTNAMRIKNGNDNFFRPANNQNNKLWLNMTDINGSFRQILIAFFDDATTGYDRIYDGKRIFNGGQYTFYSLLNNEKYAIQALPQITDETIVPIGFTATQNGGFTLSVDRFEGGLENTTIYLRDLLLNTTHNLKLADYTFNTNIQGDINNRFEIVFSRNALDVNENSATTLLTVTQKEDYFTLITSDNHTIDSTSLYNMLGQNLAFFKASSNNLQIPTTNISSGTILIIKTTLDNGSVITKKVIKL